MPFISKISKSLSTALPTRKISPPSPKQIWKKICRAVSSFFSLFSCFGRIKSVFSKREVRLLRNDRPLEAPPPPPLNTKKITPVSPTDGITDDLSAQKPPPPYVKFDDSLEELRSFFREFAALSIDILYDKRIAEHVKAAQNFAPSMPPVVKSLAKLFVEIGDKAAKPLFQKFAEQKAQVIDPTLQKIFKTLLKSDSVVLREKLTEHLESRLAKEHLPQGISSTEYIFPIVQWMTRTDVQKKPLLSFYSPDKKFDNDLIQSLLTDAQEFWNSQQDAERQALYGSIKKQIKEDLKQVKVPFGHNLQRDYVKPILDWLILTDHSTPLTASFDASYKEELIDKVFERAVSILVEKKIDHYAQILENTIHGSLSEITQQTLRINAERMTDFFSERASDLIASAEFAKTFDHILHNVASPQIKAATKAHSEFDTQKQFLEERIPQILDHEPMNKEEEEARSQAEKHLQSVQNHGGKELFLHHMLLERFSKEEVCNSNIKQIIDQEIKLALEGKDSSFATRASESAIFTTIAENLLDLMTAPKKRVGPNGEIEEIDAFIELWNRLYFPDELHELVKHTEELMDEFITPETAALLGHIKAPAIEIAKNIFKSTVEEYLKKHLIELVRKSFELLTLPKNLDELLAVNALPAVNALLVRVFIQQEIEDNVKILAPLFQALIAEDDSVQHEINASQVQQALIKIGKNKFRHFDPEKFALTEANDGTAASLNTHAITTEEWLEITRPIVDSIEKDLRQAQINGTTLDPKAATTRDIHDILIKISQESSKENDPVFGEMTMDLIFKAGGMKNEGLIGYFIRDSISKGLTGATKSTRSSHHELMQIVADSLKRSFLKRERIEELFSDQPPPVYTKEKLAHQIDVTSRLAHDLIMRMAEKKGALTKFAVRQVITDRPDELNRLITTIYKKVMGDQLVNQNLLIASCDEIFRSLAHASEAIRMRDNIRLHHLTSEEV